MGRQASLTSIRGTTPNDQAIAERIERVRQAVVLGIDEDDIREAVKAQVAKAKRGDGAALKLVLELVGSAVAQSPKPIGKITMIAPPAPPALKPHVEDDEDDEEEPT